MRSGILSIAGHVHHCSVVDAMRDRNAEPAAAAMRADIQAAAEPIRGVILDRMAAALADKRRR